MKLLYFTSTGNNLYIAKRLGGEIFSIPKLIKQGEYEFSDEKIGIIFPVYSLGVPKLVEDFLDHAKLKSSYIFAVASYGSFSGGAVSHLLKIAERNKIEFSYINTIQMVDNYLPMFDIDAQIRDEAKKGIEEHLSQIVHDVEAEKKYISKNASIWHLIRTFMQSQKKGGYEKSFYVEDNCNSCRVCERVCPVDNIKVDDKPEFFANCQECLACINHCPQKAIRHKKEKSRARFINQHVTVKEIIESNH